MLLRKVIFSFLLCESLFAQQDPSNLVLRLWGSDRELLQARVLSAAQSVGSEGRVIFDYTTPDRGTTNNDRGEITLDIDPQELMKSLPSDLRSRVMLVNSRESYGYPRDTSYGWSTGNNGAHQLIGWDVGNRMTDKNGNSYSSYSTLGIAALLNACEGAPFEFPSLRKSMLQGGQIVSNGQGVCIANSDIKRSIEKAGDHSLLSDMGCNKIIWGPSIYHLRDNFGLMNGHIDLSAIFIGPNTVMIPTVEPSCNTPLREEWRKLGENLKAQSLEILEVPVAGGCIEQNPEYPQGPGSRFMRSYSNVVVLKETLLIPEFRGNNQEESQKLRSYNEQARNFIQRLMDEGKIPKKRIIGFPITDDNAQGGGEVRCMSLEVPGNINRCSQDRLNKAVEDLVKQANRNIQCLEKGPTADLCRRSRQIHEVIKFLRDEPDRQRELTTAEGAIIRILNQSRELLSITTERFGVALRSCQAN